MNTHINDFREYITSEEKSEATVEKYIRDVKAFAEWCRGRMLEKHLVLEYKSHLCKHYAPASVNAALSSLNCFFSYINRFDCRVKALKIQRQIFLHHQNVSLQKRNMNVCCPRQKTSAGFIYCYRRYARPASECRRYGTSPLKL